MRALLQEMEDSGFFAKFTLQKRAARVPLVLQNDFTLPPTSQGLDLVFRAQRVRFAQCPRPFDAARHRLACVCFLNPLFPRFEHYV